MKESTRHHYGNLMEKLVQKYERDREWLDINHPEDIIVLDEVRTNNMRYLRMCFKVSIKNHWINEEI